MAATLYRSLTIARFWTLLEAHGGFTDIIASARRITDTSAGWLNKLVLRSVGDFPHVHILMGDNFGGQGIPFATFGDEPGGFGDSAGDYWDEERTSDFKIRVYYEFEGFDRQDALEMELMAGLEKGGRNLGYSPVKGWGPWRAKRGTVALGNDFGDMLRPVTEIIIPVRYEFTGAELKT